MWFLRLWALCLVLCVQLPAFADSQHFLPSSEEVLRSCEVRAGQPVFAPAIDLELPVGFYDHEFVVPTVRTPPSDNLTCDDFKWVRLPPIASGQVAVEPFWAGRQLDRTRSASSQFWDCNHSNIEYAVYATSSLFLPVRFTLAGGFEFRELVLEQRLVGGGELWGWLVNGECVYKTSDPLNRYSFPSGWGRDRQETTAVRGLLIALRAWSHNDPAIGHTGRDCANVNCYWPIGLRVSTAPLPVTTPPIGACPAPLDDQVVIFQRPDFGGRCHVLGLGEYAHSNAFAPIGNDSVSSIVVGTEVSVTLYQHANFQGRQLTLEAGQFPNLDAFDFNDRLSSIRVQLK